MIVARILARIEAIKIPGPAAPAPAAPPPAAVTPAQVQTIQRLVNEFRAELAALGVRVTAVEEELAALKGAKDATVVTGDWTYVNTFNDAATLGGVERNRGRLTFKGAMGANSLYIRARWNAVTDATGAVNTPDFDRVYFDTAAFGLSWRVGRNYWDLGEGLLLNTAAPGSASGARNGVRASGSFAGFDWTLLGFSSSATAVASTYAARVGFDLAGWSFGVNYRQTNDFATGAATTSGYSADFSGNLFGFDLSGEYASYGSPAATAYKVNLAIDLGAMGMMGGWSPALNVWYKDYAAAYLDLDTDDSSFGGFWKGGELRGVTGLGADLSLQITDKWSVKVGYESGTDNVAAASYNRQLLGTEYSLGSNALFGLEYFTGSGGATTDFGYAAYLTYNW